MRRGIRVLADRAKDLDTSLSLRTINKSDFVSS
jgi:hypothetical protein